MSDELKELSETIEDNKEAQKEFSKENIEYLLTEFTKRIYEANIGRS